MSGKKIVVDGYSFRSERELELYWGLLKMQKDGRVSKLDVLEPQTLEVNQQKIGFFTPTFRFRDNAMNQERFIRVKTGTNPMQDFKQLLFEALRGVKVENWA